MTYFIPDALAMEHVGGQFATYCPCQSILYLSGELGVGKTTFVRGFLNALGYRGIVKSPTYTLLEPYPLDTCTIYHIDLYRVVNPDELEYLGLRDYLTTNTIGLIEWPQQGGDLTPVADLEIYLHYHQQGRCMTLHPCNERAQRMLDQVKKRLTQYAITD